MTASLIDGKAFAAQLREQTAAEVQRLKAVEGLTPGLASVLVGDCPASSVYVANKAKQTRAVGMASFEQQLPASCDQATLMTLIEQLNKDPRVHGILVQLPLPKHLDSAAVIEAIDPQKDVDGLHVINAGRLFTGSGVPLVPCTPQGAMMLLRDSLGDLTGRDALVIGRSNLFGKPMAQLLLQANASVTMAHSRSRDLPGLARRADILIAAVGQAELVRGEWIQPGATLIDVGINRVPGTEPGKMRIVGDIKFSEAVELASHITPVPGGVGPMTVACLLNNTRIAACRQSGLSAPKIAGF